MISITSRKQLAWVELSRLQMGSDVALASAEYHKVFVHLSTDGHIFRSCEGQQRLSGSCGAGEVDVVPAGKSSRWTWTAPRSTLVICMNPELLWRAAGDRAELSICLGAEDEQLRTLAVLAHRSLTETQEAGDPYTDALFQAIAQRLRSNYTSDLAMAGEGASQIPRARLQLVITHIESNLGGDLGLDALAAAAQMSPFYFARQFKRATGQTPHQYVIAARVRRAKALLRQESSNLSEVAYQCGFSNQSHFTTLFRREVGATPHSFRSSNDSQPAA